MEWREIEIPWAGPLPDLEAVRRQLNLARRDVDEARGIQPRDDRRVTLGVRADVADRVAAVLSTRLPIPGGPGEPGA